MNNDRLRLGVVGLGKAFTLMLPSLRRDPRIALVAAADPREEATRRFASEFGAAGYATVEALCRDPNVEAVYIATPHQFHADHACLGARHGKHLLVEKPMALTLAECRAMIAAAREARVALVVGHSHSFDEPIRRARQLIEGGAVGAVRMITAFNYTDFLYRPRRPEELHTEAGGGVLFNQASHQIDVVRFIAGVRATSVRASTGAWDHARRTEGAYAAHLTFEDGVFASMVYSGYAHFDSDELCGWIGEGGQQKDPARYGGMRRALQRASSADDEAALKNTYNYGGADYVPADVEEPRGHAHFGEVIVSCERADLRPLPQGVMVHGDGERRLEALSPPAIPRLAVIDELYEAVRLGHPPLHGGEWAMATLEVCLAILESARTQMEVVLSCQVGLASR